MARIWVVFVMCFMLRNATSADEVVQKADDMAKAIAQQNKKVEEESEAMEKAIDEKGKQVDTKEQEDKFEKASEEVDAVGDAADSKFEQKANLVNKLGDDASNAIENQAKKVETLSNRADQAEDSASKLVDKIGKKIEKNAEPRKPNTRMSISYTLQLPHEPHADQMVEKATSFENEIRTNEEAEKTYPWPARQDLHGYVPDFQANPDDSKSDMSLKSFDSRDAEVEQDAMSSEGYAPPPNLRSNLIKMFYLPRAPFRLPHRRHRHRHHHRGYRPRFAQLSVMKPTAKSSDLGLLVLPSGGPRQLPEDIRTQMEDDRLLKKAAKQAFISDEDADVTDELSKSAEESNMERQWMRINTIGSPELFLHWPRTGAKLGAMRQQVSVVSPGQVDLLQTEYPAYPRPKRVGGDFPGVMRSRIRKKKEATSKKSKQ